MNGNLAYKDEWPEEIIGGEVVMMAPPKSAHNRIKRNISTIFDVFLTGRRCEYLPDGEGLFLAEDEDEYIPDGMVVCDPEKVREDGVYGAPDLVLEVLSPGTARYDRGRKWNVYEKCGVREYWIVDPVSRTLEQYILTDGRFALRDVYHKYSARDWERMKPEERDAVVKEFKCSLFDDLTIRVDDVFDRVLTE